MSRCVNLNHAYFLFGSLLPLSVSGVRCLYYIQVSLIPSKIIGWTDKKIKNIVAWALLT